MSPKMPASRRPIASTTAIAPAGIASIAARVEIGDAHDAGVARSSRAGTKRSVNGAADDALGSRSASGRAPRIQTLRRPFLSSTVVSVAVVTPASARRVASSEAGDRWLAWPQDSVQPSAASDGSVVAR
jgi:hypothetical protein